MDVIRMQLVDYANVIGNVGWREGGEGAIRQTLKKYKQELWTSSEMTISIACTVTV